MKIIKRNGAEENFDPMKIRNAVLGANGNVERESDRLDPEQIAAIVLDVERKCREMNRAVAVEEIQELVETAIMEKGAFEVAKKYIRYRYTRTLVRQANTTDNKILSLIECNNEEVKQENANKNPTVNSVQRDYMAGEVSKDITKRLLLPQDVVEAHEQGIIHFHDTDYYAQHMHNCDLVNLEDMLQNGTVISGTMIEKPHSFSTACNIATQIIAQVASNQYGGQSISLTHLAPFVQVSREKIRRDVEAEVRALGVEPNEAAVSQIVEKRLREEIRKGVQTIQYQVVTLMTTNGQAPFVTVFMYLNEARNAQEKKDLAVIIEEALEQRYQGVKNEKGVWITPAFPKLIYVLEEDNIHEGDEYYYLTELAARCTARPHGARLHLRKEDARAEGGQKRRGTLLHLHGLPQLPDPLCGRKRQAEILRPLQSGRCDHQSGGRGAVLRRGFRQVLGDLRRAARAVPQGAHVPPQPAQGHAVRCRAHPLAARRAGAAQEGRADRQAALRRLFDHIAGLCRPLRMRQIHDRKEPHRSRGHAVRTQSHAIA